MVLAGTSTVLGFWLAQSIQNLIVKECWTDSFETAMNTKSLLDAANADGTGHIRESEMHTRESDIGITNPIRMPPPPPPIIAKNLPEEDCYVEF